MFSAEMASCMSCPRGRLPIPILSSWLIAKCQGSLLGKQCVKISLGQLVNAMFLQKLAARSKEILWGGACTRSVLPTDEASVTETDSFHRTPIHICTEWEVQLWASVAKLKKSIVISANHSVLHACALELRFVCQRNQDVDKICESTKLGSLLTCVCGLIFRDR